MRSIIALLIALCLVKTFHAQPKPLPYAGHFISTNTSQAQPRISPDGKRMALNTGQGFIIVHLDSLTYESSREFPTYSSTRSLSPDLKYYANTTAFESLEGAKHYNTRIEELFGERSVRIADSMYVLGFTSDDRMVVTNPVFDGRFLQIGIGLRLVHRTTLATLEVLSTDTIFKNVIAYGGLKMNLSGTKLVAFGYPSAGTATVYPLTPKEQPYTIVCALGVTNAVIDDNGIYTAVWYQYGTRNVLFSCSFETRKPMPEIESVGMKQFYYFNNNLIYRYSPRDRKLFVERLDKNTFRTIRTHDIDLLATDRAIAVSEEGIIVSLPPTDSYMGSIGNYMDFYDLKTRKMVSHVGHLYTTPDMTAINLAYAKEQAGKKSVECKKKFEDLGYKKGVTYTDGGSFAIMNGYDCDKDEYVLWRPMHSTDVFWDPGKWLTVWGVTFRASWEKGKKQWYTCDECEGKGSHAYQVTTTRTKDLPWGYFEGISTKSIRTTTEWKSKMCTACTGKGLHLK